MLQSETVNQAVAEGKPSVPVMLGTHFSVLDDKGRLTVPSSLRPALTERFYMMREADDSIGLYDYSTGQDVFAYCEQLMAEHANDAEIAAAVIRITGAATEIVIEKETDWRISIPEILRYHAGLEKDVVTVGALNHAALWNRERWEAMQAPRADEAGVRRAQGMLLRAAASGIRQREQAAAAEKERMRRELGESLIAARESGRELAGRGESAAAAASGGAVASAGDGGRSTRLLTLQQLGRREA